MCVSTGDQRIQSTELPQRQNFGPFCPSGDSWDSIRLVQKEHPHWQKQRWVEQRERTGRLTLDGSPMSSVMRLKYMYVLKTLWCERSVVAQMLSNSGNIMRQTMTFSKLTSKPNAQSTISGRTAKVEGQGGWVWIHIDPSLKAPIWHFFFDWAKYCRTDRPPLLWGERGGSCG